LGGANGNCPRNDGHSAALPISAEVYQLVISIAMQEHCKASLVADQRVYHVVAMVVFAFTQIVVLMH
jgi:hypothetical protein